MNTTVLARYNFRVLMFRNWWLLVVAIAASQLTVFWNIITQRFSPSLPAASAEMVSPLLAAFLGAHVLSAEYRSGIGTILASKPVGIGRVVLFRLAVVMGVVWALGLLSLAAYYYGNEPYALWRTALAGAPSTLFMAMLALLFATLLRNALAGFGVAGLFWALDLPPGPPLQPYFSLRTLAASYPPPGMPAGMPFTGDWWVAKLLLLAGAVLLYALHGRAMYGLGAPLTVRGVRRSLAGAAALLAVIMASGAAVKVVYGYAHRGALWPSDAAWFRRQFSSFGPVPAASLFGPAFTRYVGDVPNAWLIQQDEGDLLGATAKHVRALREVIGRMPGSIWAPSAADLLARIEAPPPQDVDAGVARFRYIVDHYPNSPYVANARLQIARQYADAQRSDQARGAYNAVLEHNPSADDRGEALAFLADDDLRHGRPDSAAARAQQWTAIASIQERARAFVLLAAIRRGQGRPEEARRAAQQALDAARAFDEADAAGRLSATGGTLTKWRRDVAADEQEAQKILKG